MRDHRAAREDLMVGRLLTKLALQEIRALAGPWRRQAHDDPPDVALDRIWFLADLCDNLPLASAPAETGSGPI